MKEGQPVQAKNAAVYSIGGLLSLIIGYVISLSVPIVDHPEEPIKQAFMEVMCIVFLISVPNFLFVESLLSITSLVKQEKTRTRTYSIVLTTFLGGVLTYLLVVFLWENFG